MTEPLTEFPTHHRLERAHPSNDRTRAKPEGQPPGPLRRVSKLMVATIVLLCLGSIGAAASIIVTDGPASALISTLVAAVSVPLLLTLVLWMDRYEPEPTHYIVAAIGWGAIGATSISVTVELLAQQAGFSELVLTAVIGPAIEELAKGMFLIMMLLLRRRELDGILDGMVYASMVGIGFAFMENIVYYHTSYLTGGAGGLTSTFILRGVFGPFAHPLFTSIFGVGIGMIIFTNRTKIRIAGPIVGFVGAVVLHGLWNGSSVYGGFTGYILTYVIGMLPILATVIAVGVWARKREADVLAFALDHCVGRGWVSPESIQWVALLSNRVKARKWARQNGGTRAVALMRDYQQTLTELAFLYSRVNWGAPPRSVRRELTHVAGHAMALRPWVYWPPDEDAEAVEVDEEFTDRLEDMTGELTDDETLTEEQNDQRTAEALDELADQVDAAVDRGAKPDAATS